MRRSMANFCLYFVKQALLIHISALQRKVERIRSEIVWPLIYLTFLIESESSNLAEKYV